MKRLTNSLLFSLFCMLGQNVQAATVAVDSDFVGGAFGSYDINYSTGATGLKLQQINVNLQSPLFLDPTPGAPGFLLPFPFTIISGAAQTGFAGTMGVFDGATSFSLLFNDFDAGESFRFELDPDATCGSILCIGAASLTTGSEFAGTTITGVFGGSGYNTTSLSAQYVQTGALRASADLTGDVSAVPEPGSITLLGGGLVSLAILVRRRQAAKNQSL